MAVFRGAGLMKLNVNQPKYRCPYCGKVFYTYDEFEKHMREHFKPRVVGGVWHR